MKKYIFYYLFLFFVIQITIKQYFRIIIIFVIGTINYEFYK